MKKLSRRQIVYMHEILINETGGTQGIRDNGLLESALNAPFQTFDGEYLYKSIQLKATKLTFFLVKNHPFVDGSEPHHPNKIFEWSFFSRLRIRCSSIVLA
ncbi:Fic family protein [Clostridiaceae bacterium HSG29]|nr:Fic family protein [Clostridiaceae bacterium HSG29]